ncbi:hypothetical protein [Saccharothrix saharensis]|uniref:hypothetical protein n=1 Tax=Saccharothrix saharensis TaxID=571190 RepID=UPI00114DACE4|nr:hypothetical protein [Saccharothrix saharensis]
MLYAVARDETICHHFKTHYAERMHTTDLIVQEVRDRTASNGDYTKQLVKNAATDTLRRLIATADVQVDVTLQDDEDEVLFDRIVLHLRELEQRRNKNNERSTSAEKHVGEASAIVCSVRERNSGNKVVLLTNDGDASVAAKTQGVDSRHFGHALVELVCNRRITSEKAWRTFGSANKITAVPSAVTPNSVEEFTCGDTDGACITCDKRATLLSSKL